MANKVCWEDGAVFMGVYVENILCPYEGCFYITIKWWKVQQWVRDSFKNILQIPIDGTTALIDACCREEAITWTIFVDQDLFCYMTPLAIMG